MNSPKMFHGILLAALLLVVNARAQVLPNATPDPKDIPAIENLRFTKLIVKHNTHDYSVTLDVNGARYAAFDSGTGSQIAAVPFKDGTNRIVVRFVPEPTKDRKDQSGILTLALVDEFYPQPDHGLILYQFRAADNAFCTTQLTFQFASGQATQLNANEGHWVDANEKKRTYFMVSNGSVWGPYNQIEKSWSANGTPVDESNYKLSDTLGYLALTDSKDYKPDGSVAAEVNNGNGVRRTYSDTGVMQLETFYRGGAADGPYQERDSKGTLRIAGNFKSDNQDGTWIRYDANGREVARSVYANGKLISGTESIDAGSIINASNP